MMERTILKRVYTVVLAFIVATAMGVSTVSFAATPDATDTLTIKNVEKENASVKVTAYKIIEEVNGDWKAVKKITDAGITIKDPKNPTAAEITAISKNAVLSELTKVDLEYDGTKKEWKKSGQTSGMYLVLVTGTAGTVYNPMIVSVDYDKADDSVDANSRFSSTAYAKSTTPYVKKENNKTGTTETTAGTTNKGTSVKVGDSVNFTIETLIPSYSDQYTSATFEVTDTLDEGLTPPKKENVTVKVNNEDPGSANYTVTETTKGFKVTFTSAYILSLANKPETQREVVITYAATVNSKAKWDFVPNTNEAEIKYTKNTSLETNTKTDKSYIYTFGLDANLNGEGTSNNLKTHEIIKLDEDGNVSQTQTVTYDGKETKWEKPLENAVFGLYSDNACKNLVKDATSNGNGYLNVTGLSEGTYYLKEISAPAGYTVRDDVSTVVISAIYNDDGTLKKYSVNITDKDGKSYGSTYSATYTTTGPTITVEKQDTLFIKNTKAPGLPSAGGMGTYIFIITGVLIMAIAAIAIARRSRSVKENV